MIDLSELNSNTDNTPLAAEDAEQLISDLSTRKELDEFERQNILLAENWAFSSRTIRNNDPLDELYVRELHKRMFNATWKWAGKYRTRDVNSGCASAEIIQRIAALLGDVRYWIANKTFGLDEIAIRLHHRLVGEIHAFPNGNGRHARMLADVLVVKQGATRFTWGQANLVTRGTARDKYLAALRRLDNNANDVKSLLTFVRS